MSLDPVGTEGCSLFETVPELVAHLDGQQLRDIALAKASQGRSEAIQRVREWLLTHRPQVWREYHWESLLTSDDVHDALMALDLAGGDTRWTGAVLRGWPAVIPTDQHVQSRRSSNHARPIRVWRWA